MYATIIGTRYKQLPYAATELENCILDCEKIYQQHKNLMIVGDLNTSFLEHEREYTINAKTTEELKRLFARLDLINITAKIEKNIDHIIVPQSLLHHTPDSTVFVEKGVLSDHQGVMVCITTQLYRYYLNTTSGPTINKINNSSLIDEISERYQNNRKQCPFH